MSNPKRDLYPRVQRVLRLVHVAIFGTLVSGCATQPLSPEQQDSNRRMYQALFQMGQQWDSGKPANAGLAPAAAPQPIILVQPAQSQPCPSWPYCAPTGGY